MRSAVTKQLAWGLVVVLIPSAACAEGTGDAVERGRILFNMYCVNCHGEGGFIRPDAPRASNFRDGQFKYGSTDAEIAKVIRDGPGSPWMGGWGSALTGAEIDALVHYIRSRAEPKRPTGP